MEMMSDISRKKFARLLLGGWVSACALNVRGENGPLRLLNWSDYMLSDVLINYEKKFGLPVSWSTYTNEV
jgi:spermidine/putrescine-binding protein